MLKTIAPRGALLASTCAAVIAGVMSYSTTATAAEATAAVDNKDTVEGVMVTARRREESLSTVPVTITAVSGDRLQKEGISEVRDIVAQVPNAVIQDNPENFNVFINIRGMRVVDVQAEPNVGLYRNGMYIGGHRANLGAQVDIQRVEVLRGPQGGLYGRSSVGGTVDIVYATPTHQFGGYVKASAGSYDLTKIEGAINLPLGDRAALRLTGWSFNQSKSELYNETLGEYVGAYTDRGIRLGYSQDLSDTVNALTTIEYQHNTGPSMRTYAPFGISNFGAVSTPETPQLIHRDTPSRATKSQYYFAEAINYRTDAGTLTLNGSYRRYELNAIEDSDQTAIGPNLDSRARQTVILRDEGTKDVFLEAVWASPDGHPLTWMTGASYFDETFDFVRTITSRRTTNSTLGIQTALIGFPKPGTAVKTHAFSAFATMNYHFNDRLSLEAGLRYSRDEKSLNYAQGLLPTGNAALDTFMAGSATAAAYPTYTFASTSTFNNVSPNVTINYKLSDNISSYATFATGFRPGAFNLSPTTPATIPYGEETAQNYEFGLKGRFLNDRLQANLAVFYMRQKDLLLAMTTSQGGTNFTYLSNVGTGNTYGVEVEVQARPTHWLSVGGSFGWLNPRFGHAVANPGLPTQQDLSGLLIPYTRQWTANIYADADYPISDAISFIGTAAFRYESGGLLGDYYIDDPYDTMHKLDLSAGFKINGRTRVTAYVHNLLDEHISQFWFYNRGTNTSEGRTAGVDITHRF